MSSLHPDETLIAVLWRVIAAHGWPGLSMRRLAAEAGVEVATLRERFPNDPPPWTFWSYFREAWPRDAGLRIDHLLLNGAAAETLTDAGVDRAVRGVEGASDHAPVWIDLG